MAITVGEWMDRTGDYSYGTLQSVAVMPLCGTTNVAGVLGLCHPAGSNRLFSDEDFGLLIRFASLAVIAIEKVLPYAQVQGDKHYLESLLWNIPTAISIADKEGQNVSRNPAVETLFGFSADEVVGQEADRLITATGKLQEEARDHTRRTFAYTAIIAATAPAPPTMPAASARHQSDLHRN